MPDTAEKGAEVRRMEILTQAVTEYGPVVVLVLRAVQVGLGVARETRELRRAGNAREE